MDRSGEQVSLYGHVAVRSFPGGPVSPLRLHFYPQDSVNDSRTNGTSVTYSVAPDRTFAQTELHSSRHQT